MNFELTEETLEEGRFALHQLEKQLNQRNTNVNDNISATSSKMQSTTSERKILDQIPRNTRLNLRLESLGITVEGLEDRGLLDGGGAVPAYYTSMKQKGRRLLELQPRSHRLQERGKESKLINGALHMIRILLRRGLRLMEYCRQRDPAGRGLLHKKGFIAILKSIGLPFTPRELLDIAQHYLVPSSEHVDYLTFLKDAGGSAITTVIDTKLDVGSEIVDIAHHTTVLVNVKRMLADSIRRLNKHPDDVYRMFARWDTQGTGTVTATQLLRVLAKLHVTLTEFDQDFLVELLDTDAMGRIDFESLLNFCFSEAGDGMNGNPHGSVLIGGVVSSPFGGGDDTLSAVSTDGNNSTEQKSLPSIHRGRPHTATLSRPFNESASFQHHTVEERRTLGSGNGSTSPQHALGGSPDSRSDLNRPRALQRPLTASAARTSTAGQFHSTSRPERDSKGRSPTSNDVGRHWQAQQDVENHNSYVRERPDDVIDDEEEEEETQVNREGGGRLPSVAVRMANVALKPNIDQHLDRADNHREHRQQQSSQYELVQDGNDRDDYAFSDRRDLAQTGQSSQEGYNVNQSNYFAESDVPSSDPVDHLELLAQQILSTLRDIIITRYRRGKSLQEIFLHFDRSSKGSFDVGDFTRAASDLRIETSDRVATIAVRKIALDGKTNVCFGEFKVFVLDSDHQLLERNIQEQLAALYEQEGRGYRAWMEDVFWSEESALGDSRAGSQMDGGSGFVGRQAFASGLQKIGAVLTSSEVNRLVDRFDMSGEDMCSVPRFVRMIRESSAWQHAEKLLEYQDEAVEEAAFLREQLRNGGGGIPSGYPQLSEELINICEYLGIRVLSEQSMLWIASDALKAPLPISWTAQKDKDGRTYFYNHLSNQARWEHPLDPHFRKLRDKYRQSTNETQYYAGSTPAKNSAPNTQLFLSSSRPQLSSFPASLGTRQSELNDNAFKQGGGLRNGGHEPSAWRRGTIGGGADLTLVHNPHDKGRDQHRVVNGFRQESNERSATSRPRPLSAPNYTDHSTTSLDAAAEKLFNSGGGSEAPIQSATEVSRAVMESVYSAPYLKNPVLPTSLGGGGTNRIFVKESTSSRPAGRPASSSGMTHTAASAGNSQQQNRPMSSTRRGGGVPPSVVERVVNYGKNNPNYLLPKGEQRERSTENKTQSGGKFGKLFEVNVIDRLDDLIQQAKK